MFGLGGALNFDGGFLVPPGSRFHQQYHCYPVSFQEKDHLEDGDKILLPASALDTLARLSVEYPMLFEICNEAENKTTHCGVLEFSAPEGCCYIPFWMMQNLLLEPGNIITIKNVSLPKATFVKLQPQSIDFLDISNPRAVLEKQLRHFSCVTKGDHLCIPFNGRKYYLEIKEVGPADAACIIETDCNVDFDAPVGYEQTIHKNAEKSDAIGGTSSIPVPKPMSGKAIVEKKSEPSFVPFAGSGSRLDGKALRTQTSTCENEEDNSSAAVPGVAPPLPGRKFGGAAGRYAKRKMQTGAFQGTGHKLS